MSDLEGVMLSDYLLVQCIGKGELADVYRARQNGDGNYEVAVKVYRSGYAQQESFRNYFMAEAEKIGQFDHPNILPFLEFGEGEGLLYVVTPFVAPGTLEDLLVRVGGRFSAMQALPIMQQLCSAVQYVHNQDVIHGNIKPTNVFVAVDGVICMALQKRSDDRFVSAEELSNAFLAAVTFAPVASPVATRPVVLPSPQPPSGQPLPVSAPKNRQTPVPAFNASASRENSFLVSAVDEPTERIRPPMAMVEGGVGSDLAE